MIKQDTRTISKLDGLLRFEELRLVEGVNLMNINQVTPAWLESFQEQCQRQQEYAEKYYTKSEAAAVRHTLHEQLEHVQHIVEIILKSREA